MNNKQSNLILSRIFGLILSIAIGFLFLTGSRYSQLGGFFVYMSVACTLIPLPTPPYVIGIGKIFHPGIVAFVGAFGNCIAAFIEYRFIIWLFSKIELQQKVEANWIFQRFAYCFNHAAFTSLVFTGFSPIPFEPFRFAAILARYSIPRYLLAVLVGRFPRYYLIAMIGDTYQVPNQYLIIIFIVLFVAPVISSFIHKSISDR